MTWTTPILLFVAAAALTACSDSQSGGVGPTDAGAADAQDASPAPVEEQTSVTYDGVTFTFDRAIPVGQFVTGEPFALSTGAFEIITIDPSSEDLSGDGHVGHGAMQDPYVDSAQGFDSYLGSSETGSMRYGNTEYDPSLNVDPAISGPIEIAQDEETTIVKSVRLDTVTDPERWRTIDRYVPLTMLAAAPAEDAYPPSSSAPTKKLYRQGHVDESVLRSLALPESLSLDPEETMARVPSDLGLYGTGGEQLRRFRLDHGLGATENNYSAHIAPAYAKLMMLLHSRDLSAADRQTIVDRVVRFGIQIEGLVQRGWGDIASVGGGAGQQGAIHPWIYYTAFLLQDAEMLAAAQFMNTSMNANCFWVGPAYIGAPTPGKSGVNAQTFFDEMTGMPYLVPDELGSNLDTRYGVIAGQISAWETLAIMMLDTGSGSDNGAQALLEGGGFDPSNPAAAHVAYIDRYRTWTPWVMGAYDPRAGWRDLYDLVRPLSGVPAWTGVPDQMPVGTDGDQFSGGDGQISWDCTGYDYATETVTRRDMRYSLDGVQWVEETDVGLTGSVSGLVQGAPHYCGFRQVSAAGPGAWSLSYPRDVPITSGTFRNVATTTGTAADAAPSNATTPVVHHKLHPAWGAHEGNWGPLSGSIAVDAVELASGVGYWSGYPAPSFSYQWLRNGGAISGATQQIYTRTAADATASLSCRVTATNNSGSTNGTTPAVTAPPLTVLPSSTLIDTEFRGAFAVDYESEIANIVASGCDAAHRPGDVQQDDATDAYSSMGSLGIDKDGAYPSVLLPCQNPAHAGTTYTVTYEAVLGFVNDGGAKLDVRNGNDDSVLDGGAVDLGTHGGGHRVVSGTASLTIPSGASGNTLDLSVRLSVATATGMSSGGDARLTRLTIAE